MKNFLLPLKSKGDFLFCIRDHLFSTYAKFSKGVRDADFEKFWVRTKWMMY